MTAAASDIRILGIAGSLRKEAYSGAMLKIVKEAVADKVAIDILSLSDIPLYNQDVEDAGHPASVTELKNSIAEHHGLIIVTPEYNYGIPGVLKNALDWASRPGYNSVLKDKPVLMISTSPSITGGVRAISQLRQTLSACLSRVVAVPENVISSVGSKIENGKLTDDTALKHAIGGVDALIAEIKMLEKR